MDFNKKSLFDIFTKIILPVLMALFTVYELLQGNIDLGQIIFLSFILIVVIFILSFSIIYHFKQKRKISSDNVVYECNKVCKRIYSVIKRCEKLVKKYNEDDHVVDKIQLQEMHELLDRLNNKSKKNIVLNSVEKQNYNKALNYVSSIKVKEVTNIVIENIKDLDRLLLITEQYDYRIKFGKFISTHIYNDYASLKAKIDLIGWTHILKAESSKAEVIIKKAIEQIDSLKEKSVDFQLLKIRAYRHLGSNHNLYSKKPDQALTYIQKAYDLLLELKPSITKDEQNKYDEMMNGVQYGYAIAYYYKHKNKINVFTSLDNSNNYLKKSYDIVCIYKQESDKTTNKHRYSKYLILENSIFIALLQMKEEHRIQLGFNIDNLKEKIEENLSKIEKVVNDNIYADEAMLYYLSQKFDFFHSQIGDCLKEI